MEGAGGFGGAAGSGGAGGLKGVGAAAACGLLFEGSDKHNIVQKVETMDIGESVWSSIP